MSTYWVCRRLLPLTVDQKSLPDAPAHRHHEYLFVMFMHLVLTDCRLLNYYLIEPRPIWWQGSFSNDDDRSFVCLSVACRIPGSSPWWHYVHLCINWWLATDMRRLWTVLIGGHTHVTDMILESAARSGAYPSWAIHLLSVRSHD